MANNANIPTQSIIQLNTHKADIANPHIVTAPQVGNTTAQWNADQIQGQPVSANVPLLNEALVWDGAAWLPQATGGGASPVGTNLIINGNPIVNQRVYVSGTATTVNNQYTLDRWRVVTSGQNLTFSNVANIVTMTAPAGGLEQAIEGLNIQSGTHVISWVGTATCTVDGNAVVSGGTFALTGGTDAVVKFSTGTVSLVKVEVGSVATPFTQEKYSNVLVDCKRYYERRATGTANSRIGTSYHDTTTQAFAVWSYDVQKRIAPAVNRSADGHFSVRVAGTTSASSSTVLSLVSEHSMRLGAVTIAVTAGIGGVIYFNTTAGWLEADAEL